MKDNNGNISGRWDAAAGSMQLGKMTGEGHGRLNFSSNRTELQEGGNRFPVYNSPFGNNSIFGAEDKGGYVQHINFKKLIPYLIRNKGEIASYYYRKFESHATIPIGFPPFGPLEMRPEDAEGKDEEDENTEEDGLLENIRNFFSETGFGSLLRRRVDKEYKDENGNLVFLDGKLNTKEGYIKVTKECVGFQFELDVPGRKCLFIDFFYYVDGKTGARQKDWAMSIEAFRYEDYLGLCKAEGLYLTENMKANIASRFMAALNTAEGRAADMAWLYFKMPDFVYVQRDKNKLIDDLATILKGDVTEGAINTEVMVLKILQAFVTDRKEDQDNLLTQLTSRYIGSDTLFEVLYDKMNDFGGADNWTAAIKLLYKIWSGSKFADDGYYTYNGQPEALAYQSKKILGFYQSGYSFSFNKDQVEVHKEEEKYYGERRIFEKVYFTRYSILQPIQLSEVAQDGVLKIPDRIPAFYLKAFDDKNTWENFEKAAWLTLDVITTFTAVGNLLKLRHLAHIPKGLYYLKLASGVVQLGGGIAGVMLNFVENCAQGSFCQKLRNYLFWLDIATISIDAITERMLRRSAREALDEMPESIRRQQPDIEAHLDEMAVSRRGERLGQRISKAELEKVRKFLNQIKCDLELFPRKGAHDISDFFLAPGKPAVFDEGAAALFVTDGRKMKLCLREGATYYELFHEMMHLRHSKMLGLKKYYNLRNKGALGGLLKEQYVFDQIIKHKDFFTKDELKHALWYINKERGFNGLDPLAFDFDINIIPDVRKEIDIDQILNSK